MTTTFADHNGSASKTFAIINLRIQILTQTWGAESIPTNFFECLVNRAVVPDDGPEQVGNGGNVLHADVMGVQQAEGLHRKASANKYK